MLTCAAEEGSSRRELDGCHGPAVVAADRLPLVVARWDLGRHDDDDEGESSGALFLTLLAPFFLARDYRFLSQRVCRCLACQLFFFWSSNLCDSS